MLGAVLIKGRVPTPKYLYGLIIHDRSSQKSKEWEEQREASPKYNVLICFFFFSFRGLTSSGIEHTCVCILFLYIYI